MTPQQPPRGPAVWLGGGELPQQQLPLLDLTRQTTVNDLARADAVVPPQDSWLAQSLVDEPAIASLDGRRLPIEAVRDRSLAPAQSRLSLVGGLALEQRVQVDVATAETRQLVEDLVTQHTDLTPVIDAPESATRTETVYEAQTTDDFAALADDPQTPITATNDGLETTPVAGWVFPTFADGEYKGTEIVGETDNDGEAVAAYINDYGTASGTISFAHEIPAGHVRTAVRGKLIDADDSGDLDNGPGMAISVNGTVAGAYATGWGTNTTTMDWFIDDHDDALSAGEHEISIEGDGYAGDEFVFDAMVIYDDRFEYTWDTTVSTVNGRNVLTGPETHPDLARAVAPNREQIFPITEATVASDQQAAELGLSFDNGTSYQTGNATDAYTTSPDNTSNQVRARVGLARATDSDKTTTPTDGTVPGRIESLTVTATLKDVGLTVDQSWDDDLLTILQDLADRNNDLFDIRWSDANGLELHWASPGARSGTLPDRLDYTTKQVGYPITKVEVKGGRKSASEDLTADTSSPIALAHTDIIRGPETVRNASDGTRYVAGKDYRLHPVDGRLECPSDGAISDGEALTIEYQYQVSSTWTLDSHDGDPRHATVARIPELISQRGCRIAAKVLAEELAEPRAEAELTVPADSYVDLLAALDLPELDDLSSIYEIDRRRERTRLRLGTRATAADAVDRLRSQLRGAASRV